MDVRTTAFSPGPQSSQGSDPVLIDRGALRSILSNLSHELCRPLISLRTGIFPVPMGIAVEEHHDKAGKYTGCRVFVGNSPDLLVLEDTDGDDKADKRYPLLTGFGGVDSDHGVHGMVLGLDGKLY